MDTATIIGTAVTGILSGGFITAGAGAIVLVMKNRREGKIAELQATTDDESKRRRSAMAEMGEIIERYKSDIKEMQIELNELRTQIDKMREREAACEQRCAHMEEQIKQLSNAVEQQRIRTPEIPH